jgi:hypothetical protein
MPTDNSSDNSSNIYSTAAVTLCQFPQLRKKIKNQIFGLVKKQPGCTAVVRPTLIGQPMNTRA